MADPESRRPTLVLMAGPPGAGKTTLALAVSRVLGWPVIDKDTLKSSMLAAGVSEEIAGRASYDLMFDVGRDLLLHQGLSVILDSPAGYPLVIRRAQELARGAGAELRFVLCLAGHAVRSGRLAGRIARPSQWTADTAILDDGSGVWIPLLPPHALRVHAEGPVEVPVQRVLEYLLGTESRRDA
ncbi:MAG: AAA family ATPase [Actinomycetota bacterium]|nr:AAA family ATPase [Actinomycetota bacterium]